MTRQGKIALIRQYGEVTREEYLPEGISICAYVPPEIYPRVWTSSSGSALRLNGNENFHRAGG